MKITGCCCALLALLTLVAGCVVEDVQPTTAGAAITDATTGAEVDTGADVSSLQVSQDDDYAAMFGDLPAAR
jgi:hypothetical protein